MAFVFKGYDPSLQRSVAIKLIRMDAFPESLHATVRERFIHEARILARLDHPNIVKVFDFGVFEDVPFLVMSFIEGTTLRSVRKPVSIETAVGYVAPIAEALEAIRVAGLIHRDVKPSNIMITKDGRVFLTDFGISESLEAVAPDESGGTRRFGFGSPAYMSPEQCCRETGDFRSDLYSLAIVFYELITGTRPFQSDDLAQLVEMQIHDAAPDPRSFIPALNESVSRFFRIALAKDPNRRHSSIRAFVHDLNGLMLQERAQAGTADISPNVVDDAATIVAADLLDPDEKMDDDPGAYSATEPITLVPAPGAGMPESPVPGDVNQPTHGEPVTLEKEPESVVPSSRTLLFRQRNGLLILVLLMVVAMIGLIMYFGVNRTGDGDDALSPIDRISASILGDPNDSNGDSELLAAQAVLEDAFIANVFAASRTARADGREWLTGLTYVIDGPNVPSPDLSLQICFHGVLESNPQIADDILGTCSVINDKYYCTLPRIVLTNGSFYLREMREGPCRAVMGVKATDTADVRLFEGTASRLIWDQMVHSLP